MLGGKTVTHVTYKLIQTCLASALVEKYRKGNWEQEQRCEGPMKGEPWSEQRPRVDGRAAWSYGGRAAQSPGRPVPRPWAGAACSLGDCVETGLSSPVSRGWKEWGGARCEERGLTRPSPRGLARGGSEECAFAVSGLRGGWRFLLRRAAWSYLYSICLFSFWAMSMACGSPQARDRTHGARLACITAAVMRDPNLMCHKGASSVCILKGTLCCDGNRLLSSGVVAGSSVRWEDNHGLEWVWLLRAPFIYHLIRTFLLQWCVFGSVWLEEKLSDAYVEPIFRYHWTEVYFEVLSDWGLWRNGPCI